MHPQDTPDERWLPIAGTHGIVEISDLGRVRNTYTGRVYKTCINKKSGYEYVALRFGPRSGGRRYNRTVHSLVGDAFLGTRPPAHELDHVNTNKADNRACNLEYVTKGENMRRSYVSGGYKSHRAKLTEADIVAIRQAVGRLDDLAIRYGVTPSNIAMIRRRATWKHIL